MQRLNKDSNALRGTHFPGNQELADAVEYGVAYVCFLRMLYTFFSNMYRHSRSLMLMIRTTVRLFNEFIILKADLSEIYRTPLWMRDFCSVFCRVPFLVMLIIPMRSLS